MELKKVSVITPYFKGEKTIFKTIDSVMKSAEKCSGLNLEYIIIIDSMEDKDKIEKKLLSMYHDKIKILKNEINIGVAESRNKALKYAKSDYMLFLDQDDTIDIKYFDKCIKKMNQNADFIVCNSYVFNTKNSKKVKIYNKNPNITLEKLLSGNKILTPGQVLFSKRIIPKMGLYIGCSKEYKGADDWAAYINIFTKFSDVKVSYVKEPIFYYNIHENNYSKNWQEMNMSAVKTAEYFIPIMNENQKKILEKLILRLKFENKFKDNDYSFNKCDIKILLEYYKYNLFDYNKLVHYLSKKFIAFNK